MGQERKTDERVPLNQSARYDGLSGLHESRIDDISMGAVSSMRVVRLIQVR